MKATVGRLVMIFFSVGAAALGGCSGGGGGDSSGSGTPLVGVFVDSPVENLAYRTATQSGRTDAEGRFTYLAGETVTFSIGAIETPAVAGGAVLSPMTVFGADDLGSDAGAVNLARLLQSLDADLDPSNGISIGDAAHAAATAAVDLADPGFDDLVSSVVTAALGPSATLVSAADATAHLASSFPIVGAWWVPTKPAASAVEVLVLTFLADGHYVIAGGYGNPDTQSGTPGVEMGTYSWNPATGEWSADAGAVDTDGEWSFSHPGPGGQPGTARATVTVDAGATMTMVDPTGVETMVWSRVADAQSEIVGSWFAWSPDDASRPVLVTFLADGTYVHAEGLPADQAGHPGIELGSYQWDPISGALTVTASSTHDTNAEWGFSHPGGTPYTTTGVTAEVAGNDMLMGGQMSWRRIGVD